MPVAVLAAGTLVALALALALALRAGPASTPASAPVDRPWLSHAGAVVEDGLRLLDRIEHSCGHDPLSQLPDAEIGGMVSDLGDFGDRVAALSAAAPTIMDTRVCRELGVRARSLRADLETELRSRPRPENQSGAHRQANGPHATGPGLNDLRVAVRDLRDHVELL